MKKAIWRGNGRLVAVDVKLNLARGGWAKESKIEGTMKGEEMRGECMSQVRSRETVER